MHLCTTATGHTCACSAPALSQPSCAAECVAHPRNIGRRTSIAWVGRGGVQAGTGSCISASLRNHAQAVGKGSPTRSRHSLTRSRYPRKESSQPLPRESFVKQGMYFGPEQNHTLQLRQKRAQACSSTDAKRISKGDVCDPTTVLSK
jgi:hypothetical protein